MRAYGIGPVNPKQRRLVLGHIHAGIGYSKDFRPSVYGLVFIGMVDSPRWEWTWLARIWRVAIQISRIIK
jgi:hypothetical protein